MSLSRSETSVRAHRLQKIAGIPLILSPIQYWIFEAISAAAWHEPPYSYTYNWVSDLGVTAARTEFEGRAVSSPLHALMNGSFTALGLLVLVATVLLFLAQKGLRGRAALLTFGIVFAGGSWLVAGFPENTIGALHLTGAFGNIVGGNVFVILLGTLGAVAASSRPLRLVFVCLGALGLIATVLLFALPTFYNGGTERIAAYSYMVGFAVAGISFLSNRRAPSLRLS